ncbi:hypothetical protein AcW1_000773 [Taiwanofungus camphoratus]|nr:hypothetical protein AcW1_000773 [Antrodia cinnamomea]
MVAVAAGACNPYSLSDSTMPPASFVRALQLRAARSLPSTRRYASHGHGPQYNEPTGWLFGEKPPPPGQKRQREDWEIVWYVGMYGSMALATVLLYYKPDTSFQSWAYNEAKARMEARGEKTSYP